MKRRMFISILLLTLLLTTACRSEVHTHTITGYYSQPAAADSEPGTINFTDALDQEFSIGPPQRAAVMIGSFADVRIPLLPPPTTPGSPTAWTWVRALSISAPP